MSWRLLIYMISLLLTHFQWKQISCSLLLKVPPLIPFGKCSIHLLLGEIQMVSFPNCLRKQGLTRICTQVALQFTVNFLSVCTVSWACSWRTPPGPSGQSLCFTIFVLTLQSVQRHHWMKCDTKMRWKTWFVCVLLDHFLFGPQGQNVVFYWMNCFMFPSWKEWFFF